MHELEDIHEVVDIQEVVDMHKLVDRDTQQQYDGILYNQRWRLPTRILQGRSRKSSMVSSRTANLEVFLHGPLLSMLTPHPRSLNDMRGQT
jgi:hypothetical protein